MSITLSTVDGALAVEIADHRGRLQKYRVEVLASTPQRFSVRLHKLGADGVAYLVQAGPRWHACDCKDARCRRRFVAEECKHVRCCKGLRPILSAMATVANSEVAS